MIFVGASVYDNKAKIFLPVFFTVNQDVAQRAFSDAANGAAETPLARNPEDYCLFIVGTFNDDTGEMRAFPQHINLGLASQYIKPSPQQRLPLES